VSGWKAALSTSPGRGDLTTWGNVVYRVRDTGFGAHFTAFSQGGAWDKLPDLLIGAG
jgi:hypothetical protein